MRGRSKKTSKLLLAKEKQEKRLIDESFEAQTLCLFAVRFVEFPLANILQVSMRRRNFASVYIAHY